jgi:hypothetical protein
MRWFRANRKFGGRFALFALAIQFCLSFGHIHPEDIYGPANVTLSAAETIVLPPAESLRPITSDNPWYTADGLCPICETMYFLGTSFVPEAPQVPLPLASQAAEHFEHVAVVFIAPRRSPFQSRAPPLA